MWKSICAIEGSAEKENESAAILLALYEIRQIEFGRKNK